jgi:hypothetical protein
MHKNMSVFSWVIAASIVLVLTAGIASAATVTQGISFQGNLTDAAGTPLTGTYFVTFRLYNVASGGIALATNSYSVMVSRGQFTTTLYFPAELYNGQGLWLGIQRAPDPEKTPRTVFQPVPYALSLRPGATVVGSLSSWALKVQNSAGTGLTAVTTNDMHPGLLVNTSGSHSSGLHAETRGAYSPGLSAITNGIHSPGVYTETYFAYSPGLSALTKDTSSPGVYANTSGIYSSGLNSETSGAYSPGLNALTKGTFSPGVNANTSGIHSSGLNSETRGAYSPGLSAVTSNVNSPGVYANTSGIYSSGLNSETRGAYSPGLSTVTSNINSPGVYAETSGDRADGVHAYSKKAVGIFAATGNTTHRYGVYTPDKMSALGYETNSGDVAEFMRVTEDVIPGMVLVIGKGGVLQPSATAYDTHVAGIVSTQPGVSLGTKEAGNPGEALIAVAGKVPCNVDASNGPITEGDLLTTSSLQGYAMKATDPKIGTVLGKAMGTLESGTGTIEVLVTLQ